MGMEHVNTTAVYTVYNISNVYDCTNSSFIGVDNATNVTACGSNATKVDIPEMKTAWDIVSIVIVSIILGLMTLTTIVGNVFVIAAIILERNLQSVANYLILSLAVADLLVAVLVMPIGAIYEISKEWMFGATLCDMWTTCDLLCCTASILHLLAIATDRYWAVTQVNYIHQRNIRTIGTMILLIWLTSVIVSLAPLMGWKDEDFLRRINEDKTCMISQDVAYQVFATMSTFYVPLLVILILYAKIFMTARNRLRKRAAQKAKVPNFGNKVPKNTPDVIPHNASSKNLQEDGSNHQTKNKPSIGNHQKSTNRGTEILTSQNTSSDTIQHKNKALASTAARINPISKQVQTIVVSNSYNSESNHKGVKNDFTTFNNTSGSGLGDNFKSDTKILKASINCKSSKAIEEDNDVLRLHDSGRITSSKSIIPVYNNKLGNVNKSSPQFDDNEESVPLIQNSTLLEENLPKNDNHQISQCKKSETMPGLSINKSGNKISTAENTNVTVDVQMEDIKGTYHENLKDSDYSHNVQTLSSKCTSNNINQIKLYQNQACQTEGRSKRHVNFERLDVDQSNIQQFRSPLKILTNVITKKRQDRHQSGTEQAISHNKSSEIGNGQIHGNRKCNSLHDRKEKKHVSLEAKRERKAAKTLAIVTGAFIACWLPFFILAILMPILKDYQFNPHLVSFFLWLGYFNSTLNPMIYTIFSPEFRQAFQRILCGKSAAQNHRPRHLQ